MSIYNRARFEYNDGTGYDCKPYTVCKFEIIPSGDYMPSKNKAPQKMIIIFEQDERLESIKVDQIAKIVLLKNPDFSSDLGSPDILNLEPMLIENASYSSFTFYC